MARNAHLAVGYWGRNLNCRIVQEQIPEKIKELLQDKLLGMGRRVQLWLPVTETTPGVVACTCDKETRPGSDYKCLSCYGMRFAPGYLRFLHETIFFASAEFATFTFVNTERDTTIKPNRIRLTSAALTGTVTTPDKPYTNPAALDWTQQVAAFRKTVTDTILVEFSTDAGATWTDVTLLNGPAKPTGTGNIRFRITLTRASIVTDSPDFEILRMRRPLPERMNPASRVRMDLQAGEILILRTWVIEQVLRQIALGRQVQFEGDKSWTADLAFFDNAITPNTAAGLIRDRQAGPHPFYAHASGVTTGERLAIFQVSHNDNFLDVLTHQAFFERKTQEGELYGIVF